MKKQPLYHFPLYLNRHIEKENLFSLSGRGSSIGLIRSKCCCENRKIEIASASSENALNALKENMGQLWQKKKR